MSGIWGRCMLELVFFKGVGGDFGMEWNGFELGFGGILGVVAGLITMTVA